MANETHTYTKLQTMFGAENIGSFVIHHPRFGKFLGSQNAALIMELLLGWDGQQWNREGWIYKTADEMELETGLTEKQQSLAIKKLLTLGVIKKKLMKVPARNHFRIDKRYLQELWIEWLKANPPPPKRPTVPAKEEAQSRPFVETTTYIPHEYTHTPTSPQNNFSETEPRNRNGDFETIAMIRMKKAAEETKRKLREEREREEAAKNISNNPNNIIPSGDNSGISDSS